LEKRTNCDLKNIFTLFE